MKHFPILAALIACFAFSNNLWAQTQEPATGVAQQKKSADETDSEWISMTPTGAGASFQVPVKPRYVERSFSPVKGKPPIKVHLHLASNHEGKSTFIFGYHDLHEEPADAKALDATLDGAVRGSIANVRGQLVKKPTRTTFKGAKGRQFIYRYKQERQLPNSEQTVEKTYIVISRVFLLGKRQYQLSSLMERDIFDENYAAKFLNSFQFVEPEPEAIDESK